MQRFCSYVIFLLRDQCMIARLSEAMGAALVGNNCSPIPWKFHFQIPMKENLSSRPDIYTLVIKTFLTVELSQYRKSGSTFFSSEPVAARSDCHRLGNASPVRPAQAVPERGPKCLAIDFAVKSSRIVFGGDCTGRQGLELGLKPELCRLTNWL